MYGLRFLIVAKAIGLKEEQVEAALCIAVQDALYGKPVLLDPQELRAKKWDISGYQGAHAALNADLDMSTITWERLPQLLTLRVLVRQPNEEGRPDSISETTIWMRPGIRVQHTFTVPLATQV